MIFKRIDKEQDVLLGKIYNSLCKTGFMNEDVYKSKDRDIWTHMKRMLSDVNTSSVFENIMIAYEELSYDEAILQKLVAREYKDKDIHSTDVDIMATTTLTNVKFVRCLFVQNPSNFKNDKRLELINTIKELKVNYRHMTLCDDVIAYLNSQIDIHTDNPVGDVSKNLLHADKIVTLVIPLLIDNSFYNTNGTLRYPYLSEMYHHIRTVFGQISFIYKTTIKTNDNSNKKTNAKYSTRKRKSYFDVGEYQTMSGETISIFYVKIFNSFYNPFMFLEVDDVMDLVKGMNTEDVILDSTRDILLNTYRVFVEEVNAVRKVHGNYIPAIVITKENDAYYDDARKKLEALRNMVNDPLEDEEDEDDNVVKPNTIKRQIAILEDAIKTTDEENKVSNRTSNYKLARNSLSAPKVRSLIMGFNNVKKFGYFPHFADVLLKYTDMNDSKKRGGVVENPKQFPKSFQIISTVTNDELFTTNDGNNPLDWLFPFMYRKSIVNNAREEGITKSSDSYVDKVERYLTEDELGIIDPHTKKSESSAGLQSSINPFLKTKSRLEVGGENL